MLEEDIGLARARLRADRRQGHCVMASTGEHVQPPEGLPQSLPAAETGARPSCLAALGEAMALCVRRCWSRN